MRRILIVLTVLSALLSTPGRTSAQEITPPGQPSGGRFGPPYPWNDVDAEHHGEQPTGYWLFEPTDYPHDGGRLPLVIFLHGYTATDPLSYRAWIDHIVRQGRVVVFPDYQVDDPLGEPPLEYTGNMIDGVTAALAELATGDHAPVALEAVAVAGHSMGGVLALNYAALAGSLGLPVPVLVMPVTPGGCRDCDGPGADDFGVPYRDLSEIDPATKLVLVVGEDDDFVGQVPAQKAWSMTDQIAEENRDYLVVRTDRHGSPELLADHVFPQTAGPIQETDALDWYGPWKLLDATLFCALTGFNCDDAMNGGPGQLDMGKWSDGTPVTPPLLVEGP